MVVAAVVHTVLALGMPSPWIVPDELIYSELARSLAAGEAPSVRDEMTFAWGLGYPALLAPVWTLGPDAAAGLMAAKVVNALAMSLTVVPTYFLSRRFLDKVSAIAVAALTVFLPGMLYAGTLMTEVALYPLFMLVVLAMAAALEDASRRHQAAVLGAVAVAFAVKSLVAVLIPAWVGAILLFHWLDTREANAWRVRVRSYRPTWLALGLVAVVLPAMAVASGRAPQGALGTYSTVLEHMDIRTIPRWILLHVAEFDLYLAVIPLAASTLVLMRGLSRLADRRDRLFASLMLPIATAWFVAVGAFASVPFLDEFEYPENVTRLQGRSTFMLAPLFLIGLAMFLRQRDAHRPVLAAAVVCAVVLPAVIPLSDMDGNVRFQALALVPWVELGDNAAWPLGVLALTGGLGVFFLLALRAEAPARLVVLPVVLVFVGVGAAAHSSMQWASDWTRSAAWGTTPDWVDAAVPKGSTVSVLWAEPPGRPFVDLAPRHRIVLVGEFFNRSLGAVYELGSPMPYGLPTTPVALDGDRVVTSQRQPADLGPLVLVPCHVRVAGTTVARDPGTRARVVRVDYPLRARVASPDSC